MSISPLSNNVLFQSLLSNPFKEYHQTGLNVTLSTDDPMQFHTTQEPLIEEYTIAKQLWKLTEADLGEIANRSVRQSGFSHEKKQAILGVNYQQPNYLGNEMSKTNIPDCRVHFRHQTLSDEFEFVWLASRPDMQEMANEPISSDSLKSRSKHSLLATNVDRKQRAHMAPAVSIIAFSPDALRHKTFAMGQQNSRIEMSGSQRTLDSSVKVALPLVPAGQEPSDATIPLEESEVVKLRKIVNELQDQIETERGLRQKDADLRSALLDHKKQTDSIDSEKSCCALM